MIIHVHELGTRKLMQVLLQAGYLWFSFILIFCELVKHCKCSHIYPKLSTHILAKSEFPLSSTKLSSVKKLLRMLTPTQGYICTGRFYIVICVNRWFFRYMYILKNPEQKDKSSNDTTNLWQIHDAKTRSIWDCDARVIDDSNMRYPLSTRRNAFDFSFINFHHVGPEYLFIFCFFLLEDPTRIKLLFAAEW